MNAIFTDNHCLTNYILYELISSLFLCVTLINRIVISLLTGSEMYLRGNSVRSWCDGSSDRSVMVESLGYFSFQPMLHDWCNKGRGMCYHVCGMVHIKEPLLLIGKSSPCGGSGFPLTIRVVLYHMSDAI